LFTDLPQTQATLIAHSWMADRVTMLADPFGTPALQTVAAFASLHVSVMVTASLIASMSRLRPVAIQWALWLSWVRHVLATVCLGWHYVVEVLGGVVIGFVAVWTAAYGTGNRHRLPSPLPTRPWHVDVASHARAQAYDGRPLTAGHLRPER